jgi:hypothetical protein
VLFTPQDNGRVLQSACTQYHYTLTYPLKPGSSDSLAVGDDFDWQFSDTGTNYSYDFYSCDFTSTNGDCIFACATDDPVTSINTSVTAYYGLAGSLDTFQSIETNAQVTVNNAFKFSQLTCNVTSNSVTGDSTINLRKNAGFTFTFIE